MLGEISDQLPPLAAERPVFIARGLSKVYLITPVSPLIGRKLLL